MFKTKVGSLFISLLVLFTIVPYWSVVYAANATLSLSPATHSVTTGDTFNVQILLNTGGARTAGTDVSFLFDKSRLNVVDVTNGTLYDQYIGKNINNEKGFVALSGIASSTASLYTGSGVFATIQFRAVAPGTANVTFDFTPGDKNDSNVGDFDAQADILTSVTNGTYTISGTSTSTGGTGSSGTTTTSTGTTTTKGGLPVTANALPLIVLTIVSLILVGTAIFLFRHKNGLFS